MWPLIIGIWVFTALIIAYNAGNGTKTPRVPRNTTCLECGGQTIAHRIQLGGGRSSYDLTECADCTHITTYVHGMVSRLVYCPDCSQRTLEVSEVSSQDAQSDAPRRLEEACHICGYSRNGHLLRIAGAKSRKKRGLVIRFPNGKKDSND